MDLGEWLRPNAIGFRVGAQSKRQALAAAADLAERALGLDSGETLQALIIREGKGSTGVGHGVALPHARIPTLTKLCGVFLRLDTPCPFDAVDEQPVDLLFALFAPQDSGSEHLRALARVARLFRRGEFREQLRQARTPDALYAVLVREASVSAA
jgi:nitrogen PTS system EIIA component